MLTKKAKNILDMLAIESTPIRIEIVKAIFLKPSVDFTITEINRRLMAKGKNVSLSTITETLLSFRIRGLLCIKEKSKSDNKAKPGRPATKLSISKKFYKMYAN